MRSTRRFASIVLAALMAVPVVGGLAMRDAEAVIGRPLTPVSYAGVARRTARRTTRRTMAVSGTAGVAAPVTTLPAGCARTTVSGTLYYGCGGSYYRPYYQGSTVVYRTVTVP